MDTKTLLQKVRKIEIKTRGLSTHIFSGEYHSAFKGRGMAFSEVREYQFGDDVRAIDWNVTARLNHPYVKVFEEERELTVVLLVDISRSGLFGTRQQIKRETITEICAVLAFSAIQNNDKVGVIFFSDQVELFIPPKKGRFHTLRIIRELLQIQAKGKGTDLTAALDFFNRVVKKRSIVFVLSDFFTDGYSNALSIAARRHDLVGIQVYDPTETALPNVGLLQAVDAETGRPYWIDTARRKVRQEYATYFAERSRYLREAFMRCGKDMASIATTDSYVKALMALFKKRDRSR